MKKILPVLLFMVYASVTLAQHTEWRTGIRDTSYSNQRDLQQNIRHYPFIKQVPDEPLPDVAEERNMVYAHIGDRTLHIDAFIPKNRRGNTPAVLIIHGGGWRSGNRSQHIPLAQHLAAKGIACFTVEYRLSTEAFYPAAVYDLKAAVRWLHQNAAKFHIADNHIAILGFSAGGELAAFTGMTNDVLKFNGDVENGRGSVKVNAVIDIDGTLSFVDPDAWETKNPQTVGASCWWIGYPRTERLDLWTEASPLTYASDNKVPFLFINSSIERMHVGRDTFKNMMKEKNIYVQVKEFADTPHSFCLYQPWFSLTVDEITGFLNKVFK